MPRLTPRQQLTERVAERLHERGLDDQAAYATAVLAVAAWYARNADAEFHMLVCQEALASVMDVIPAFASNMRAAFEGAMANALALTEAMTPWMELAERFNQAKEPATPAIKFDASGLPVNTNPEFDTPLTPADRRAEPCIEEGCGADAVPGTAFCADCVPTPSAETQLMAVVRDHITGDTTEHPVPAAVLHFGAFRGVEVSRDQGETWEPLPGVLSIEVNPPSDDSPIEVFEMTEREVHLAAARTLRKLGCTYGELKAMHDRGDFETAHHHSAWFNFGNLINLEQLDRANFVLDNLARGDAFDIDMDDAAIQRAEAHYPEDRITGAPYHYVVNSDHSACGCNGHDLSCTVWSVAMWNHKPTLCRIPRTLCTATPRHTYGEPCDEYHDQMTELVRPPAVGQTTEGEDVRGPAAG